MTDLEKVQTPEDRELERDVFKAKGFCKKEDRDHITNETRFFYVGQTKHRVECRFMQHRRSRTGRQKGGSTFDCYCENATLVKRPFNAYNRGNKFVRKYALNVNSLRPKFLSHYNPIRGLKAALQTEQKVADELRGLGHLVHCA